MGRPKAPLTLAGRPLIGYPIAAARKAGLEPLVFAKPGSELPPLDCEVLEEPAEPIHPLTGIVAALGHAGAPVVVLACDMPLVPAALIAELAGRDADLVRPSPAAARRPLRPGPDRAPACRPCGRWTADADRDRARARGDHDGGAASLRRPGGDVQQRQ
jgi:molybdopterin-guanine dinucleotide biosynthesis protein A